METLLSVAATNNIIKELLRNDNGQIKYVRSEREFRILHSV